jgi:DNA/RNA-binding domain of Phe-tRNA-synthetase-like protein
MREEIELSAAAGFIDPALREEFPGLRLDWLTVPGALRPSPPEVKHRLQTLSNRYRGANVVAMRTKPIPHAYRTFFHQIGLDPDGSRIPSERVAVERLLYGGFRSQNLIEDAQLIALIETGVPVWALDADQVEAGGLGVRLSRDGERLGDEASGHVISAGRLVVADARRIHALLFDDIARGHLVTSRSRRVALFAVGVEGVPAIHVEESLWAAAEVLGVAA